MSKITAQIQIYFHFKPDMTLNNGSKFEQNLVKMIVLRCIPGSFKVSNAQQGINLIKYTVKTLIL